MMALVLALALLAAPTPPPPPTPPGTPPPSAWGKAPVPTPAPTGTPVPPGRPESPSLVQQIVQNFYRVVVPVHTFLDVFRLLMGEITRQAGEHMAGLAGAVGQLAGFSWEALYPTGFWEGRFREIHRSTMAVTGAVAALMVALAVALHAMGRAAGVPSDPRMILLEAAAGVLLAALSVEIVSLSGRLTLGLVSRIAPGGPLQSVARMTTQVVGQIMSDPVLVAGSVMAMALVLPVYMVTGFATLFALTGYATLLALWPVALYAAAATGPLVAALWMARPTRFLWWVWLKLVLLVNVAVVVVTALMAGMDMVGGMGLAGGVWRMFQMLLAMGLISAMAGLVTRSATVSIGAGVSATIAAVRSVAGLAAAVAAPAAGAAVLGGAGAAAAGGAAAGTMAGGSAGGMAGPALASPARTFLGGASLEAAGHALGVPSLAALGRTVSRAGEMAHHETLRQAHALREEAVHRERAYRSMCWAGWRPAWPPRALRSMWPPARSAIPGGCCPISAGGSRQPTSA